MPTRLRVLALALALVSGLPLQAADKVIRYISLSQTRLLSQASAFSKTLARLEARTAVEVLSQKGAYYQVKAGPAKGWIPVHALQASLPRIGYNTRRSSDTSAEEVAAATKGFNSDIEAQYGQNNPALDYKMLDRLEARTAVADPLNNLAGFRRQGRIGEFAPGGAQ